MYCSAAAMLCRAMTTCCAALSAWCHSGGSDGGITWSAHKATQRLNLVASHTLCVLPPLLQSKDLLKLPAVAHCVRSSRRCSPALHGVYCMWCCRARTFMNCLAVAYSVTRYKKLCCLALQMLMHNMRCCRARRRSKCPTNKPASGACVRSLCCPAGCMHKLASDTT